MPATYFLTLEATHGPSFWIQPLRALGFGDAEVCCSGTVKSVESNADDAARWDEPPVPAGCSVEEAGGSCTQAAAPDGEDDCGCAEVPERCAPQSAGGGRPGVAH